MSLTGPHEREMYALRQRNSATCIAALRDHGVLTLSELTQLTGLSRPTIETIITELKARGLVSDEFEAPSAASRTGRPARQFAFVATAAHVASVDLGLHSITVLVSDLSGTIVASLTHETSPSVRGGSLIPLVGNLVRQAIHPLGIRDFELASVVVSVTGIVDDRGRMLQSNLLPEWNGVDLVARFGENLSAPIIVENDVNMAAVAEVHAGAAKFADDVVVVMVGHRINSAIILGGTLYRGRHFAAGEVGDLAVTGWGYNTIDKGSVLGAYADGTVERVFDLARSGDPDAKEQIASFAAQIIQGIALVGLTIDPDLIVIGGGVSRAGETFLAMLNDEFLRLVKRRNAPPLVGSSIGANGVAVGGIVRALEAVSEQFYGSRDLAVPKLSIEGVCSEDDTVSFGASLDRYVSQGNVSQPEDVAAESAPAGGARDAASDDLRIAVVGFGMRSAISKWAHQPGEGSRVVAVADSNPTAEKRVAEHLGSGITFHTDYQELSSNDVDAAIVVTPDDTHYEIAAHLLRAGIAVYLDKPIAISIDDADDLLRIAKESGSKLYIGHNMRHMAVVRLMREIIERGDIGEVKAVWCRHFVGNGGDYYFKDWHADRSRSNGLLLQKGAHDLDIIHWLANSYTSDVVAMGDLSVYGAITDRRERPGELMTDWFSLDNWPPLSQTGLNPVVDVEDQSMVLMKLQSGVLASYEQCHFTPDYWRNYTVIGTEGRLENFGDGDGGVVRVWNSRSGYNPGGDREYPIVGDADGHGDADMLTVAEFVQFVRNGHTTETSPIGARNAVATAVAATESLRNGSTPQRIREVDPQLAAYFAANQV
ncbi:ROK family protein [Lysinibacter cavernae]|uniref:Putative dehydrogenase/putative NBD/HSP70 family sugar kinase n=1 Tax=Lysinibacter cavernae TaxID=1640652 RepID=A0A7X5TU89_9MICO|nr:putative dehydrogenase/putative NBD/HSP70 family sugar kinase [Lysinibacter cavernae]